MNEQMNESDDNEFDGEILPFTRDGKPEAFPSIDRLLSAREVAYHLGLQESWVYRAARCGAIPVVRLGKYRRFNLEDVRRAIDERED